MCTPQHAERIAASDAGSHTSGSVASSEDEGGDPAWGGHGPPVAPDAAWGGVTAPPAMVDPVWTQGDHDAADPVWAVGGGEGDLAWGHDASEPDPVWGGAGPDHHHRHHHHRHPHIEGTA